VFQRPFYFISAPDVHGQCDARPTVTFPAREHHRPLAGTKLHCLVTEARVCEQLAQGRYVKWSGRDSNLRPTVQCPNHYVTTPHLILHIY